MKLLFIVLALAFLAYTKARKFDHVRKYFVDHDESFAPTLSRNAPIWIKNSNTIGLGYNPLQGSPVCYTGICQGDGFRHSVFKLNYAQPATGSCTSKLIPDFVELHCVPSADLQTSTEIISTSKQLSESTSKGISFGADVKYKMFSAGYSQSRETRSMIDQMMKQDTTATFTRGQVTWGKLSMFEPFMKLTDTFNYVIEQMPCCDDSSLETDEYIQEFLIDYFGLTFVTELILGGIAQETMFIANEEIREMQSNRQDVSHSASVGFILTFNVKTTSSEEKTQHNQFMKSVKSRRSTKLGGDPSAEAINDWIKSVPENPVIINYAVKDILTLLTRKRFPNDIHIGNKSKLVEMAIQRYLDRQKIVCFSNCTDSNHGECNTSNTAPLLLGTCECRSGWKGGDCSEKDGCSNFVKKETWNYMGNDLGKPTSQTSYANCCVKCFNDKKCEAFTWHLPTKSCYLKSSIGNGGARSSDDISGRRLGIVSGGTYKLINRNSGKVLDVDGGQTHDYTNVIIHPDHNSPNQHWTIYENEDGTVTLINPKSGKALDVDNSGTSNGTNVQIFEDNETAAQKWFLKPGEDETYTLINVIASMALDVALPGMNVRVWEQNDSGTQKWQLARLS